MLSENREKALQLLQQAHALLNLATASDEDVLAVQAINAATHALLGDLDRSQQWSARAARYSADLLDARAAKTGGAL